MNIGGEFPQFINILILLKYGFGGGCTPEYYNLHFTTVTKFNKPVTKTMQNSKIGNNAKTKNLTIPIIAYSLNIPTKEAKWQTCSSIKQHFCKLKRLVSIYS